MTETRKEQKIGRYYIKDQLLRFWFRYVYRNQSLIEIGDVQALLEKIHRDLPTYLGWSFEELVRALLLRRNDGSVVPFRFTRIGGFWTKRGDVKIDIVALHDDGKIFFGECKTSGKRFSRMDAKRLKEKAKSVMWRLGSRVEHFGLFCMEDIGKDAEATLAADGIAVFGLSGLIAT